MILVGCFDNFIAEALSCRRAAAGLFGHLNLQHRHGRDGAHPFVNLRASLRVGATQLGEPRALELDAVLLNEGAECSLLHLHGLVLRADDDVGILQTGNGMGMGSVAAGVVDGDACVSVTCCAISRGWFIKKAILIAATASRINWN